MTAGDSVELLFRARMEGQADIDRYAKSVAGVGTAAAGSGTDLNALEKVIKLLTTAVGENTSAVNANTTALASLEAQLGSVGASAGRAGSAVRSMTGNVMEARAAVQALNGNFGTLAASRWLATIQGIGPALSGIFAIAGPLAMLSVLNQIVDKVEKWHDAHDPLIQAQSASLAILRAQGQEYDRLHEKARALSMDEYERVHGRTARLRLEASESGDRASGPDDRNIQRLGNIQRTLQQVSGFTPLTTRQIPGTGGDPTLAAAGRTVYSGTQLTAQQASALHAAGMEARLLGDDDAVNPFEGVSAGSRLNQRQIDAAREVLRNQISPELETARERQKVDTATTNDKNARADKDEQDKAAAARKKADEAALKRKRELDQVTRQADEYLRSAQTFELTGLQKINAEYDNKIAKLKEEAAQMGKLSPAEQGRLNSAIGTTNDARKLELGRELKRIQDENLVSIRAYLDEQYNPKEDKLSDRNFSKDLQSGVKQDTDDINAGMKILGYDADASATAVRRRLQTTIRQNGASGRGGTAEGASDNYAARIEAANQIYAIETQSLFLIDDKDKRDEAYAEARKKRAEEVYQAEAAYEEQLQGIRDKDLQKYQSMAESLFDAIHSHRTNIWGREFATNQVKQVFTNVTAPVLQQAGHMLGSIIPSGSPLASLFHGTVFDPTNKGADVQKQTADNTKDTADQVKGLRSDIRALSGGPPASGSGTGSSSDLMNLPFRSALGNASLFPGLISDSSGILGTSGIGNGGLFAGTGASSLFQAGSGSGFTQFMSGLGGAGSNPLGAIFTGMSTNGSTTTQLTGIQQAGAAVGTAAMLAGAAMSAIKGFSQGGVGGISQGISSVTGAAAMLDPEPISKAILGGVAAVSGIVGALFGTGPQQRSKQLFNELSKNQYLAPTALNVTQGMNGTYEDFDARGNIRTSTLSAVPTVAEPYITSRVVNGQRTYYDAPGNVLAPYGGSASGTGQAPISNVTNISISAIDTQSFSEFARRPENANVIGEATADHLDTHDGRLANAMRFISKTS